MSPLSGPLRSLILTIVHRICMIIFKSPTNTSARFAALGRQCLRGGGGGKYQTRAYILGYIGKITGK